jgi:hypothetical protein
VADDKEVAVKLSADVKSLLQGMKDAQEHTEKAVAGMKGDLGSAVESFEKFGAGALAIGAVGLAFEGMKEAASSIMEAVHATNELTESFESLKKRTGASFEDLTVYKNALMLTGGTMGDLSGILNGLQRKLAASPEIYIANKVAANAVELAHQDLMTTLAKSVHAIASIEEPGRRSEVAIALLGSRALSILPQIMKMNEMIEKEGPAALKKLGAHIDDDAIAKLDKFEIATGTVKLSIEKIDQTLADSGRSWATWSQEIELAWKTFYKFATEKRGPLLSDKELDLELGGKTLKPAVPPAHAEGKSSEGGEGEKTGKDGVTPKELEAQKKAAEERRAMRKAVDEDIIRSAAHVVAEQMKDDKELVASGQMTYAELTGDMKDAYKIQLDTAMKALKDEEKLAAGKPAELQAILNKEKELNQKYYADLRELDRQAAENGRKERAQADADAEKARKQNLDLAKIAAADDLNLLKTTLEEKDLALDQALAFGRVNEAQWVAMKKAGITQELRAQLDALDQEQKAAENDLVAWKKIQAQKDALNRKAYLDLNKLDTDLVNKSKARWNGFFGSMTGGWNNAIQGLVNGTMTWGNAFKTVTDQALSGIISFFVQWAEEEAIKWATSMAMGETGRVAEATGAAAVYAVNAMGSVAAIPFYGWAMAPAVGAQAYGAGLAMAGLASAAGGWDRVPADQVAQIHKNEMILPAPLAEGIRQNLGDGSRSGGGSVVHHHWNVLDGQDVKRVLTRHQDALFGVIREGGKNRRI